MLRGDLKKELTPRELQVVILITEGLSNKEIAARLGISPHTMKGHAALAREKLGLHSKVELTLWAIRNKLVEV
jgi:DNA-binding NarL/FixJ family response regulator